MANGSVERPYGWVIVGIATMCLTLGFGANVTVSILIGPLESEFNWLRADISFAYTMLSIGAAVGGLYWGALSDKIGARRIGFLGSVVISIALVGISLQTKLWAIYALYFLIGSVGFACLFTPMLALTGLWFDGRKGLALGIVTAGGAIGQGIIPALFRMMITEWGWREATFYLGIGYFVILVPLMFLLRPPPLLSQPGNNVKQSDDTLWGLPHKTSITWLAVAGIFCCICMAVPIIHLVPLGTDLGLSPETATSLLFALMISGTFGRIFFGLLADRIGGLYSYAIASLGQTVVVFWFTQTSDLFSLYVLAVLFGFGFSGVMTCLIICSREAAPLRITGFAVAVVTATAWVGMGVGGYQGGFFYDLTGSYTVSYANAAAAGVINLTILALLVWFRKSRTRQLSTASLNP
ncbi:MAG: MFS transporter [Rhodospirillales bacterium]|nr:MFS transporter [Rhodospirillales bacterium]